MSAELKPCPFCGSPAEIDRGGFGEIFAACTKCWCHMGGAWTTDESTAAERWNTRAAADALPGDGKEWIAGYMQGANDYTSGAHGALDQDELRLDAEIAQRHYAAATQPETST